MMCDGFVLGHGLCGMKTERMMENTTLQQAKHDSRRTKPDVILMSPNGRKSERWPEWRFNSLFVTTGLFFHFFAAPLS